ncbi:MAG: hypothetical protein JNJ58_00930 [Chitinophagaceae bacterium]|nr:hypothetical protein [Chitinophagaceae bacterium]
MKVNLILNLFILSLFCQTAWSQVPQKMNYQGIARNAEGLAINNAPISIKIAILPSSSANLPEFSEVHFVTTNEFGLYTLQIGAGVHQSGNFKYIKWEQGNKFIRVAIDPVGGNNFIDAGTTELLSVPYALYAERSGTETEKTRAGTVTTAAGTMGDANKLAKFFSAGNTITNSQITDNGNTVIIGNPPSSSANNRMHIYTNNSIQQTFVRMENVSPTGSGRFMMGNDSSSSYATFTKYGTGVTGNYGGSTLYPNANILAFGNNGLTANDGKGRLLISSAGNVGIALSKTSGTKIKFHADYASENVGIGGGSLPVANVHINNTLTGDTLKITNTTTGHTINDGLDIRTNGNASAIINRENSTLDLGTNNTPRLTIDASGNVGIGTTIPVSKLDINGQVKITGGSPGTGKVLTSDANGLASWAVPSGGGMMSGTAPGQMLYWDGTQWQQLQPGQYGSTLHYCNNAPSWGPCVPLITSDSINMITSTNALGHLTIVNSGGTGVTEVGFCWSTAQNPTIGNSHIPVNVNSGASSWDAPLDTLLGNTTYYARAYAINSAGVGYGAQLTFNTNAAVIPFIQNNGIALSDTVNKTYCIASVLNNGGSPVTSRGIYYSTFPNPTNMNAVLTNGSGNGSFQVTVNAAIGTIIYWVPFATNAVGTAVGTQDSFTVTANIGQYTAGGYVFYVDGTGLHGMVAAPIDLTPISCDSVYVNAPGYFTGNVTPYTIGGSFSGSVTAPLSLAFDVNGSGEVCTPPVVTNLTGKIAVVDRGTCTFYDKVWNAYNAGAVGVLLVNNANPLINMNFATPPPNIPIMLIDQAIGSNIKAALANNVVTVGTLAACHADRWGCSGTLVTPDTLYAWNFSDSATNLIVNNCSQSDIAAKRCSQLILNGYSDWLLPTIEAADWMYQQLYLNAGNTSVGGTPLQFLDDAYYWSSTQYGADNALTVQFTYNTPYLFYTNKFMKNRIRPIRNF